MRRFSVIIILALALVGCAAAPSRMPDTAAQLDVARKTWLAGNYELALPLLARLARAGNPRAQYALGYMYYTGQGVEQSQRTALVWIRRAANNGSTLAIQALGRIASGSLPGGVSAQQQHSGKDQD
ncbi:MAG: SEL1-like repeat protein [Nitrococcus sp.]|nr:SEL1-like repeat protein [Nitrococcus sp.]